MIVKIYKLNNYKDKEVKHNKKISNKINKNLKI